MNVKTFTLARVKRGGGDIGSMSRSPLMVADLSHTPSELPAAEAGMWSWIWQHSPGAVAGGLVAS